MISTSPTAITSFADGASLSAFNVLDETDYNQWYTGTNGKNTILVSNFVYHIKTLPTVTTAKVTLPTTVWDIAKTGDKLCYASTLTTKNVINLLLSFKLIFVKVYHYGLFGFSFYSFGFSISFLIAPILKSMISTLKITYGLAFPGTLFSISHMKNISRDYLELLYY